MNKELDLPWQTYPKKFIQYASNFENTKDEFERLIGYLLLDVGVETFLKAFVLSDTSLEHGKRDESIKGLVRKDTIPNSGITAVNFEKIKFHKLLETVKAAAQSKVTDEQLKNVGHYHAIRNIIYHEGRKTIPSEHDFKNYLILARLFLNTLLNVTLENPDQSEDQEQKDNSLPEDIDKWDFLGYIPFNPWGMFNELRHDISIATTLHRPKYATRSFEEKLKELWKKYVDTLAPGSEIPASVYGFAESELVKEFNTLTGQKLNDTELILEICNDVPLLQFGVFMAVFKEDVHNEMKRYIEFRDYSMKDKRDYKEITKEDVRKQKEFSSWIEVMQERINAFIEEKISKL